MSNSSGADSQETTANDARQAAAPARHVRVAVVQMDFHPAVPVPKPSALDDPLFDMSQEVSSLLPDSGDVSRVVGPLKVLRRRVRRAYLDQIRKKIEAILDACRSWDVQIVVFPEYSIPPALLESVAQRAGEMVVVAGTHYVDHETLEQELYEKLGALPHEELLEHAVSPVLYRGRLIGLVPKLQKTLPEHTFLKVSNEWAPVALPEGLPGPLGVLICLDNLSRQSTPHREHVGELLASCRFIAAPSLTPTHSLDEVYAKAQEDARRQGRPVLFANYAAGGGSTIYIDEGKPPNVRNFPAHAGYLDPGEEGVIVADIDLRLVPVGSSTRYEPVPTIRPFAAASFLYAGIESEYAVWLERLRVQLDAATTSKRQQLRDVKTLIGTRPSLIEQRPGAQQRRFQVLALDIDEESDIERLIQLTREIVLPEDVLPLKVLRAALARGAADEVQCWVSDLNAGEFGLVANRLRKEWQKTDRAAGSWRATARRAANEASDTVRGGRKAPDPKAVVAYVDVLEEELERNFEIDNKKASELFDQGRHADARNVYRLRLELAHNLIERADAADSPKLRRLVARCQLNVALATLNLQEPNEALVLLLAIEAKDLSPRAKVSLAEALAVTGAREKAEAILPAAPDLEEADRPRINEVLQLFELLDGRVPEPLVESASIRVRAAALLVAQGILATGADLALEVIRTSEPNPLTIAFAVQALTDALRRTIFELPPVVFPIPVARRGAVIEELETYFSASRASDVLPEVVRTHMRRFEAVFRSLTKDSDWFSGSLSSTDAEKAFGEEVDDSRVIALRLALAGRPDEALRALPPDATNHPWMGRFGRVEMLAISKQFSRALDEALTISRDYPARAPIEHIIAELYANIGRPADALKHAELAYEQLPANGYRLLLAGQCLANNRAEVAWDLMKGVDDDRPLVLRTRAFAAQQTGRSEEAEKAWLDYVKLRPEDASARVGLAQLLFRMHQPEKAAAVAWKVYEEQGKRLDLEGLYACAWLQRMAGALDADQRRRILKVAAEIKERFPGSADAEQRRLHLLMTLGEIPREAAPTDFDLLVAHGHATMGTGETGLIEFLERQRVRVDAIARMTRVGALPNTTAAALTNTALALVVTRILERSRQGAGYLCPSVSLSDQPPTLPLEGAKLLVSDLELLLLEVLDLIPALRAALGPTGKLVLLSPVQNRIHSDFGSLHIEANREKLETIDSLLRQVERLPLLDIDAGAAVVADRALLRYLRDQGAVDATKCAAIEIGMSGEPNPPALPTPLPAHIAVSTYLVENLFQHGALRAAFEAPGPRLFIRPEVKLYLRSKRDDLAVMNSAAELAESVHRRMAEDWVQKDVPEPLVPALPPLRDPDQSWARELILEPLQEMVAYRYAMLENPTWWRVSAEFYGSASFGVPELTAQLAWSSTEDQLAIVHQMKQAAARDLTLPVLIRILTLDPSEADLRLLRLAELGFPDALGASELLRLELLYEGLDKAEPRRILDSQEWMAREPGHMGGDRARLRLAHVYATTIFQSVFTKDRSAARQTLLFDTLLRRQEAIGNESATNTLDQTFAIIASTTADFWQTAWKPHEGEYAIDPAGPVFSLWQALSAWSRSDGSRRAAQGRATREVWRALNRLPGGPPAAVAATLELAHWVDPDKTKKDISLLEPEVEALTILSFRWKESPFAYSGYEELLVHGADMLQDNLELIRSPRDVSYSILVGEEPNFQPVLVRVPVEALLLRAPSLVRQKVAKCFKVVQGPYDGRSYEFLDRIERSPDDVALLGEYAEHASVVLFRLVQDDPAFIRIWGQAQRIGAAGTARRIDELREVLSEPNEPLQESLYKTLMNRLEGPWSASAREDAGALLLMASEVPGTLVAAPLPWWLEQDDYDEQVKVALERLDHLDEFPIARIAGDMIFLRVAANRRPLVKLGDGDVDLREVLPGRLERLLENVMAPSPPDTLGAAEAALLRVCGEVVQRLSYPEALPLREGLWLTYRLFQWLCLQLASISPDARRDGIRRLVAQAPQPSEQMDLLDPSGFGRDRFDLRLAVVLNALGAMEELSRVFYLQIAPEARPEPRSVSSSALEDKLLALARRAHLGPRIGSVLDWNAPDNVPDLALKALLHLSGGRFAELGSEARIRRFEALPEDPGSLEKTDPTTFSFAQRIVLAAAAVALRLEASERTLLEVKLRAMVDSPKSREWRWVVFVSFFAAGMNDLETEARDLTIDHLDRPFAPIAFGKFLLGVAARDPARLERATETIFAAAVERGADVVALATGALGRLVVHGKPPVQKIARALLLQLAQGTPFSEDPRMDEVIAAFGLRENKP